MRRIFRWDDVERGGAVVVPRAATVGFFDGVHRGHIQVLDELKDWARVEGDETAVVTFDRHPQAVLGGHPPVPVISLEHRLLLIEREGIDVTLVLPFDAELASWSPELFVERVLCEALGVRKLLFGFDGAFGHRRQGSFEYLRDRQREFGLDVRQSAALEDGDRRISSTDIRDLLRAGDLASVGVRLGRPYSVLGRVVRGELRGRQLGFPTANLNIGATFLLPRGVYLADVSILGSEPVNVSGVIPERHPAVINVGSAPTFAGETAPMSDAFDAHRDKLEAHLLDFSGDLYGQYLEVHIHRKIRDERKFSRPEDLVAQIELDVAARRGMKEN